MNWYLEVLKKYIVFNGRARRKEYWMFVLFNMIIATALAYIQPMFGLEPYLYSLYMLAVFLPTLAVVFRRLHDTNRSGWWLLFGFIPLIGAIVLFVFMIQDSWPGENRYGPNPKETAA